MAEMTMADILLKREGPTVEFKRELDAKGRRYLESVVAFLNTDGGTIYFGVDDGATAAPGIDDPDLAASRLIDAIISRIAPPPDVPAPERIPTASGRCILALHVPRSARAPHALRDGADFAVYRRVADRNQPLPWSEVVHWIREQSAGEDPLEGQARKMLRERERFLQKGEDTALRIACWPGTTPHARVPLDDGDLRRALVDPEVVGVRPSGWNYLSSTQVTRHDRALSVGLPGPPAFRHLRVFSNGRVEFTTGRDELWSWHAPDGPGLMIDPLLLTEYPASILALASWIHRRFGIDSPTVLVEQVLRRARGARLGPGRPDSIAYRFHAAWGTLADEHLCVPQTEPLRVASASFLEHPDAAAFELARAAYDAFGLEEGDIPFYDANARRFTFPR